ncbi:unnamed protein product [Didymodactylos carnosus]|uniref:Uncharacterized protein n=1 Tax=Didymodactylos carnosus TaxID=1234261 RepID=A0A816ED05_9BILA|nr:unnamed protein product [Didymodactylos carnosus]CAF1647405.1 unnamed protein product [Didymodactylos carnosus]CAF4367143.1 unnamed protein product [Didymodactylos carnosus]CAF4569256.1 unnamed protein product [Didymodactylos carnosus]
MHYRIRLLKSVCHLLFISFILFLFIYFIKSSYQQNDEFILSSNKNYQIISGVITTLIKSTHESINMAINMLHSIEYHYINYSLYPIIIFHDKNLTNNQKLKIRSCVKKLNFTFELVDFDRLYNSSTKITMMNTSYDRGIGYRLMCRFWVKFFTK